VDQVVGDLDALSRAGEAVGIGDVADAKLATGLLELPRPIGVADQAARPIGIGESDRQPAADESGCACDQRLRGDGG
jgi:hypothetical protein